MFGDSVNSATPIRFPSTANLNINSDDRFNVDENSPATASDFMITQNQNILSGYFTRLAIVEIVLDWGIPNVSATAGNDELTITIEGSPPYTVTLPDGFYTISSAFAVILADLATGYPNNWTFNGPSGSKSFSGLVNFTISDTPLAKQLGLVTNVQIAEDLVVSPYLLPDNLNYLDFVSPQLTYQQGLKDATTAKIIRDVLYRWNFGWDSPTQLDPDGYPIQQGYTSFVQRRYLSFPKQIKWTGTQPIGQLSFQVYDAEGKLYEYANDFFDFEWSMNILVSES